MQNHNKKIPVTYLLLNRDKTKKQTLWTNIWKKCS